METHIELYQKTKLIQTKEYLLLIDEEAEIKPKDKFLADNKYIVTCDERVSESFINGNFYRSKSAKIIAYYPLTKEAKELDLPLLPNPFEDKVNISIQNRNFNKQVKNPFLTENKEYQVWERAYIEGFDDGAAQAKQFSLEDMKKAIEMARMSFPTDKLSCDRYSTEHIIQSLSTPKVPKEFIPEYDNQYLKTGNCIHCNVLSISSGQIFCHQCGKEMHKIVQILKTIINSEGKQELVGTYEY